MEGGHANGLGEVLPEEGLFADIFNEWRIPEDPENQEPENQGPENQEPENQEPEWDNLLADVLNGGHIPEDPENQEPEDPEPLGYIFTQEELFFLAYIGFTLEDFRIGGINNPLFLTIMNIGNNFPFTEEEMPVIFMKHVLETYLRIDDANFPALYHLWFNLALVDTLGCINIDAHYPDARNNHPHRLSFGNHVICPICEEQMRNGPNIEHVYANRMTEIVNHYLRQIQAILPHFGANTEANRLFEVYHRVASMENRAPNIVEEPDDEGAHGHDDEGTGHEPEEPFDDTD